LIDVHVHLREPGGEQKEEFSTGSAAALAGGITMVLDMPNTYPPVVDAQSLERKIGLARRVTLCDIGFYAGAAEDNAQQAAGLAPDTAGLKIYLDQTYGPLRMRNLTALLAHMSTWPAGRPIAVHAEGLSAALAIGLARSFGRRLHLCHVSRADEIRLVRAAKESGAALSCEVTPHHLFLTEADAGRLGPYGAMMPPLGSEADVAALWENLEVVDCIATDHAPHTREEKEGASPPPGDSPWSGWCR
jgi:carbamoyl-phosphate synthase/aspartate carbamoyltransferase/dihydroorotase